MKEEREDKNFDSFFRDRFENFSGKPASDAWSNIQANLEKKPAAPPGYKLGWWKSGALLVFLGGLAMFAWYLAGPSPSPQKPAGLHTAITTSDSSLTRTKRKIQPGQQDKQGASLEMIKGETAQAKIKQGQTETRPKGRALPDGPGTTFSPKSTHSSQKRGAEQMLEAFPVQPESLHALVKTRPSLQGRPPEEPIQEENTQTSLAPIKSRPENTGSGSFPQMRKSGLHLTELESYGLATINYPGQKASVAQKYDLLETNYRRRKARKPTYLSLQVEPSFSFYRVLPNRQDDIKLLELPEDRYRINANLGMGASFQGEQRIRKSWSLSLGLRYSSHQGEITYVYQERIADSLEVSLISNREILVNPLFEKGEAQVSFNYKVWGLSLGGRFHPGKWHKENGLGVQLSLERVKSTWAQVSEDGASSQTSLNPALSVDYRLAYPLGARWQLRAEPNIRFNLGSVFQDAAIRKIRPYHWGLRFGLAYRLR